MAYVKTDTAENRIDDFISGIEALIQIGHQGYLLVIGGVQVFYRTSDSGKFLLDIKEQTVLGFLKKEDDFIGNIGESFHKANSWDI